MLICTHAGDGTPVTIGSISDSFGHQFIFNNSVNLKEGEYIRVDLNTELKRIDSTDLMQKVKGVVTRVCSIEGKIYNNENYIKVWYKD